MAEAPTQQTGCCSFAPAIGIVAGALVGWRLGGWLGLGIGAVLGLPLSLIATMLFAWVVLAVNRLRGASSKSKPR